MTAGPSFAPALALVLAALSARDARAQVHRTVEERALLSSIHRDLGQALRDNGSPYALGPALALEAPRNAGLLSAAAALGGVSMITMALSSHPALLLGGGALIFAALAATPAAHDTLGPVEDVDSLVQGGASVLDFFHNRLVVRYVLEGPDGWTEDGSCLAFFALEEGPDGSRRLHYALDNCSHAGLFPQAVPMGDGDLRIGPDGVDVWDELLGQTRVVAKGSVPVP